MEATADRQVATVDDVLITPELALRPSRPPDYEAESRALVALVTAMAESPESVLQKLADTALELCRAGSAGISVWEPGGEDVFRWRAIAGDYTPYLGGTMPRDFSPCGTVLDRNTPLLMADPVRFYPYISKLCSPVREVLLVPFYRGDRAVGTVWVVSHSPERRFDAEDARLVTSLSRFAGAAVLTLSRIEAAERAERDRREREEHYRALVTATSDVIYRVSPDWSEMRHLVGRKFIADTTEPSRSWLETYIPADEQQRVTAAIAAAVRKKKAFELEHRVLRVDGSVGWAFSRAVPVLDEAGNLVEWFGAASDVTERKRAGAESRRLAERLGLALDAGNLGTWEWDPATDGMIVSGRAGEIYGIEPGVPHSREALRGLIHPDDRDRARDRAARAVAERTDYDIEYRLSRPEGEPVWVAARGRGVYDATGKLLRVHGVVQDVTERRRAEEELRDIRSRMETALAAGAIGTWAWDVPNDRFYGDASLARIFSVPPAVVAGGPLAGLISSIHPDDREHVGGLVDQAIAAGGRYEADYRVTDGAGGWRWVTARGQVERDAAGRAVRFPGVVIDVTDRKRAEEALTRLTAESERRKRLYEAVLSSTPDLAYVWGLDHRFTYANEGLLRMWGKTWDEAIGRNCLELGYEPWHAEMHSREIEKVKATRKPLRGEVPFAGTFGRRVYDYILVPVLGADGEVEAVAGTTRDVTDRKAAEEELRKQTERMRLLWEAASLLLTSDDPETMMRELFARIAPHFGLDTYFNFMVDPSGEFLRLASCLGIPQERVELIRRLEFGQAVCGAVAVTREPITATYIQQSDDPRVQLVKGFGIRAYACNPLIAGDRLLGTLSFATRTRDTFDTDELEFLRTVCHYVTVAYDRVRLIRELREGDRKKDDFIALLAHELRNPLAPIRNGLQVTRLSNDPGLRGAAQAMMDRQLTHMVRLIDDLLDISRINRNKMELRRARVALSEVVAAAVETARPLLDEAGHKLSVTLPGTPVYLDADLTRLAQVFSNLLTNSARYTPKGGRIWLAAESKGAYVEVSVRDTGIGIPRESLSTIFDMFSQVDRSIERSTGGLGIGLALVKGFVEMHGGTVRAESQGEGMGSTFTVSLPVLAGQVANATPVLEDTRGPSRRVLVVDDNRDGADSLAMTLQLLGHDVRTAYDGAEAVEQAEQFDPQVILMDVGMPRMSGLEATRRIREQPWGRAATIIALTGWGQEHDRERSRDAGCDGHLVKPVEFADLQQMLAGTCG